MDYDKLIEQLNAWNEQHLSVVCGGKHFACDYLCENEDCIVVRAATAIETICADLARVTAERDALIKRTAGDCWSCIRRYECNSRKGPHSRCWEFDPWLLKED